MTLKQILTDLGVLKQRVDAADKAELARIEGVVNETVAKLQADLTAANASVESLTKAKLEVETQVSELNTKLSDANKAELDARNAIRQHLYSLPGHEDYKDGGSKAGASLAELIEAEAKAVSNAVAATGVKLDSLPGAGSPNAPKKALTYTELCKAAKKSA